MLKYTRPRSTTSVNSFLRSQHNLRMFLRNIIYTQNPHSPSISPPRSQMAMAKAKVKLSKISPFRLASLLRLEKNPSLALHLFQNPNPNAGENLKRPFRRSARCYDLIICKLGKAKMFAEMGKIIDQMLQETRFTPKETLFCHVISLYGRAHLPVPATVTFRRIPTSIRSIKSFNSLLDALLRCRKLDEIRDLCRDLDSMGLRPDACTYNILIRASGSVDAAMKAFDEMTRRGIEPTVVTFGTLVSTLCEGSRLDEAFRVKDDMVRIYNLKPNVYIYTSLMKELCKRNELDSAVSLKNEMQLDEEIVVDSAVYSTIVRTLFQVRRKGEVVAVLEEMKRNGVSPDVVTYNSMVAGFCNDKDFDAAFEAVREMERKGLKPDVISYNTIVSGFCKEGMWRKAAELFEDMPRRGCQPDVVTYRMVFDAMCSAGEFGEACLILDEMVFKGYVPGARSARSLVEGLVGGERRDWDLIGKVVCGLAKGRGGVVMDEWEIVVGGVLKESEALKVGELMDYLING